MFLEGPAEVLVDQLVDKLQPEVDRTLGSHPVSVPMCGADHHLQEVAVPS
jgi:hypothetical protein